MENEKFLNPNYVPDEFKVPYDVIELPSQGLLYPNKKSSVKVEYLTAYDENVLTSPNLLNSGKFIDILVEKKVKDLGFDHKNLLIGDRLAILLYLRTTGFGNEYIQYVFDEDNNMVEGTIDLTQIKTKKLDIKPDSNNEFDYTLPISKMKIKFKLLTIKDIEEIELIDEKTKQKNNNISTLQSLKLERSIMEIDGERDKLKISHILKSPNIKILDIRNFNKYVTEIEPGIDTKTNATISGGKSVECFLRFGSNFWFPKI